MLEAQADFARATMAQTLEVATARVYNWDVTQKRKERAERGAGDDNADADDDDADEKKLPNR